MLRKTRISNKFCTVVEMNIRPQLKMRFPQLWLNTQLKEEHRLEDFQEPQSVITQKLKFLCQRNELVKGLKFFSVHNIHSSYFQKALYELENIIEVAEHSRQTDLPEKNAIMHGLKLFHPQTPEQIQLLKFHLDKSQCVSLISFLDAVISLVSKVETFQDSLFVNLANNLFELFSDPKSLQKNKQVEEKLTELFFEIGEVFHKFDYLSSSQPLQIAKILGQLFDLIIINCTKPNNIQHYSASANVFIQKYYEIHQQKMILPTVVDYKNILYTIFLSEKRPEALIQDAVDRFANCGIQNGNISQTIDIMSMMLLYNIPCTENFLNRLKKSKRSRLSISQLFVLQKCYEFSKIPIYEFSLNIFSDVASYISQDKWNEDANSVLMLGRICNGLFQSSFVTSKFSIEKRNDRILNFVEKNVFKFENQLSFNHILFLSNVFNRHLSQPFFLNHYLYLKLKEIQISEFSLSLFNDFFEITYEFYKEQYTYYRQIFVDTAVQPTSEYQTIVKTFVEHLVDTNLNPQLLLNILKVLSLQSFSFGKSLVHRYIQKFDLKQKEIHILAKLMQQYNYELTPRILNSLLSHEDNQIVFESLYYICQQGHFDQTEKKALSDLASTLIHQLIAENEQFLIPEREIDDFVHTYSAQLNQESFYPLRFIPVILTTLNVHLDKEQLNSLIQLFERTCVSWYGDNLIINLILINKMNIRNYNIYLKSAENFLSSFNFSLQSPQTPLAGLLEDEKIQIELIKAYFNQVKYADHKFCQGLKIIGYLAFLNSAELDSQDIMLLCKMLGRIKEMYFSQHFEYLLKPLLPKQLPNKEQLIKFCSHFPFKNDQIHQLLLDHLKTQPNIQLSSELLLAAQTQLIFIDNIDQLFSQLKDGNKKDLIKPTLQHLINTWDIAYPIDTIMQFAESIYDQQDTEFKFIYIILQFFHDNSRKIKVELSEDSTYHTINDIVCKKDENAEERILNLCSSINIKGLECRYNKDEILYFPTLFSSINQNEKASYKISVVKKSQKFQQKKPQLGAAEVSQFIQHQINLHDHLPQYKYLDSLFQLQFLYDYDLTEFLASMPKQLFNKRIQKIKTDNNYLDFTVSMQFNAEAIEEKLTVNTGIELYTHRAFIGAQLQNHDASRNFLIQYLSQNDYAASKNGINLTPLKLLECLSLRKDEEVIILNFQKWKELYNSKEQQQYFIRKLMSK